MLHHMNRAAAKTDTPSVSYRSTYSSTANQTTYTFSASDIGPADNSRLVVVQVHGQPNSGTRTVSTLTIAGAAATGYQNTARLYHNSLWTLPISFGTTATIVVTFSGSVNNCLIAVYALYDLQSFIPIDTQAATTAATTASLTISTINKGVVVAGITGAAAVTTTWTGVTERYDTQVESAVRSGGDQVMASTNASYSVQSTTSGTSAAVLVAGSWR